MSTDIESIDTKTTGEAIQQFLHVDPATLVVGANARIDARLDRAFIASIRERGVLTPILAYHDEDARLVVLHGQRRTLAAVDTGRQLVPVAVVARPQDVDRLVDQVSENDHRAALTTGERVAAYEQLAALGVSAAQIAKRTAAKKPAVVAGLAVAGSAVARGALQRWDWLDLEQAAVLAEFDDDPEAVKRLSVAAKQGGGFNHVAQRLRDERTEAAAVAASTAAFAEQGLTIVARPAYNDPKAKRLDQLLHDGEDLTAEAHAACPGHAAFVVTEWRYADEQVDAEGGIADDVDPDAEATLHVDPVYVCTDFAAHGHTSRYGAYTATGRPVAASEQSDTAREAARAERRDVIESNKAWVSAETVRRDWLRGHLGRKTAPKGAALFVADGLARCGHGIESAFQDGHRFYLDLLGLEHPPGYDNKGGTIADLLVGASEARAQMVALGLLLAAYEAATSKDSWRHVNSATARYLRYLQSQGYELADVERRACGDKPGSEA